jgi:hypothetical protein
LRWGKTNDDDPVMAPAPELLDIEITTKCSGMSTTGLCGACYKKNSPKGINMSLERFKEVIDAFPKLLSQIAIGADSTLESNPDLWKMMEYSRSKGIVPNITCAEISEKTADKLAANVGACAISYHDDKDICYNSVKMLTDRGMGQINIHFVLHEESYPDALELITDMQNDSRLEKMNALVFLLLKKKGRAKNQYNHITEEHFNNLVSKAFESKINFGFDSCSAPRFMKYIDNFITDDKKKSQLLQSVEPCESFGLMSSYINVHGHYFPCSFAEGEGEWKEGIPVTKETDFIRDVWNSEKLSKWRQLSLSLTGTCKCNVKKWCRICPIFDITPCFDGKITGDRVSK